jgi:hypothetical protein
MLLLLKLTAAVVMATDLETRVRFPVLPDFLRISESGTGSAQACEYK